MRGGGRWVQDHYDVKMPCHLLLAKLAAVAPAHVLAALDGLVEPLNATLNARVKSDAVKQEVGPAPLGLPCPPCPSPGQPRDRLRLQPDPGLLVSRQ